MSNKDIFDSDYISKDKSTEGFSQQSEIEKFMQQPVQQKDIEKYGSSKPRRIIIKAKISDN